jgi:putative exporter of polyketide antibiotics
MEILFLIISIILTILAICSVNRLAGDTNKQMIKAYKDSEELLYTHFMLGLLLVLTLFITLCACNNTFWHLPYLLTK